MGEVTVFEAAAFIRANLRLASPPLVPEVQLYTAHAESGLRRLAEGDAAPYWAYSWAGGLALARHFLDYPETVAGKRILDLGSGSGLVAIAAMKAGAAHATAAEIDTYGRAAIALNAVANDVKIAIVDRDFTAGKPPPRFDLIAAGDVFYERELARRMADFIERCAAAKVDVLIGDPGRQHLPTAKLRVIAEYAVPDVGDRPDDFSRRSTVYAPVPPEW